MLPRPSAALLALLLALPWAGCDDVPTETVSRCHPNDAACAGFLGAHALVEADLAVGARVFGERCAKCHGPTGKGVGDPNPGDLTDPAWQRKLSDDEIAGIIKAGRGMKMPGFQLPPLELRSVIAHLRTLAPAAEAPPARERGKGY